MNSKQAKESVVGTYRRFVSPLFDLEVLVTPPTMILTYDGVNKYTTPKDISESFEKNSDEKLLKSNDGYVYFRDQSLIRMKDISKEIVQIFQSKEMTNYLNRISNEFSNNSRINIVPDDWTLFNLEGGKPEQRDYMYMNVCYNIPSETHYKMSIAVNRSEKGTNNKVDIFITYPESLHFDGQDSLTYPFHLKLIKGTIKNIRLIGLTNKPIKNE